MYKLGIFLVIRENEAARLIHLHQIQQPILIRRAVTDAKRFLVELPVTIIPPSVVQNNTDNRDPVPQKWAQQSLYLHTIIIIFPFHTVNIKHKK